MINIRRAARIIAYVVLIAAFAAAIAIIGYAHKAFAAEPKETTIQFQCIKGVCLIEQDFLKSLIDSHNAAVLAKPEKCKPAMLKNEA